MNGTILHMVPAEKQTLAKITLSSGFFPPDAHGATFPRPVCSRQGLIWLEDQKHGWARSVCLSVHLSIPPSVHLCSYSMII